MKVEFKEIRRGRYLLKVIGYTCPFPTLYTLRALEKVKSGETLEVLTDSRPSCKTIPEAVTKKGHHVISVEHVDRTLWKIVIKKKG